ncbi:TPA: hypothetical protein ACRNDU_005634 [Pseudomonas aeruginosa]|uniref:Uncharacterized protein n=1 Tax=Pseudomonas juntendi TaxID=2666183 RepID=A0ABD4YLE4_9PSED|nr:MULTISPECIES: hypothetical protein [Pseudomonas]MDH0760314.1 hypothetical protein [Pseudomonas juntendi]MDH1917770.1 hypothetical protein [Pseudomonas juntendi]TRO35313.1 hypothetical protein EQ845_12790 [Pseudomonas putida]
MNEFTDMPLGNEEENDVFGSELLSDDSGGLSDPGDVRNWLESFDSANLFEGLDAFDLDNAADDAQVDFLGTDETVVESYPFAEELGLAALNNLSNLGAQRRKLKKDELRRLDEEDFEDGVTRLAFRIIKANVEALFAKKLPTDVYVTAAQWVFGPTLGDWAFDKCCEVLGARKDVIRLRIHYEFWRRWYVFPVEFPFMIDPVPEAVADEIFILAGDEGYDLARVAWGQPGIRSADLLALASGGNVTEAYRSALERLSDRYMLSQQNDCWYLTGRNPALRAVDLALLPHKPLVNQISWSSMF